MDFSSLLYGPIYGGSFIGVDAVLTLCGGEPPLALTAIDKTSGKVVGGGNRFSGEVETVEPVAFVKAAALASIDLAQLRDATLQLNGKSWTVRNHMMKPSTMGEAAGEVMLILAEMG